MRNNKFKKIMLTLLLLWAIYYSYNNYFRSVKINSKINRDSEHYINDLYQTDAKFYNQLNSAEKKLFKKFVEHYENLDSKVKINFNTYGCQDFSKCNVSLTKVYNALWIDHPELLQVTSLHYRYATESPEVTFYLEPLSKFKLFHHLKVRKTQRIIEDIRKETENMTDYEKIIYVYEWMGDNAKYDYAFTYSSKNQSAYNSLVKGKGVCASFAKASQLIFQNIGIESQIVRGYADGDHMWNLVKYNGKYYQFDPTVSAGRKKDSPYYYDGLIQKQFSNYSMENAELHPKLAKDEFFKK